MPLSRPPSARLVAAAAGAAVVLGGCGILSPHSPSTSPAVIYGARTGNGGRSLVLGYEDGGCGGAARQSTQQSPTVVTVTVDLVRDVPAGAACPADSHPRILVVALTAPLGHRTVVDGSTHQTVGVFDGSRLLHPTVFPDGLTVRRDAVPGGGSDSGQNWTQTYSRARAQARCSTSPTVLVTQGTGIESLSEPNDPFTPIPGSHEVAASPAEFEQDPGSPGQYYLEWSPRSRPGWRVLLQAEQACRGGPALSTADLLRFADSLE